MHPSNPLSLPILKRSSYYDADYRASAALLRARRPYIVKNAVTGAVIAGFAIGVFAFTLHAVGQDTFDDVIVPTSDSDPSSTTTQTQTFTQPPKTPNVGTNGVR